MDICLLKQAQWPQAVNLVWDVFMEFEAPEYAPEGIHEFRRFLDSKAELDKLCWWGAFDAEGLAGVLAMRGTHISLFFVRKNVQRQGVGKALFQHMAASMAAAVYTVNSSPFAVAVYSRLGFVPTEEEQITNGIRYTPMVYRREQSV